LGAKLMSKSYPVEVILTPSECYQASMCGVQRTLKSLSRQAQHRVKPVDPWGVAIEGAAAELAVAKTLGLYWDASIDTFGRPDIISEPHELEIEVKLNSGRADGDLMVLALSIIRPDTIFILVVGMLPTFKVVGWARGEFVMHYSHRHTMKAGHENYIVPQALLNKFPIPMKGFSDEFPF
jgi:hypothetical protein